MLDVKGSLTQDKPKLYVFSGLPGVGKSTLAERVAKCLSATHLRIDSIEQALKDIYQQDIYDEGYQLAYRMAADSLNQGQNVVADSCNSVMESRQKWQQVATGTQTALINIEVVCSDDAEHEQRVESRGTVIPGLMLPTWKQVQERDFLAWEEAVITIDTAGKTAEQSIDELCELLLQG